MRVVIYIAGALILGAIAFLSLNHFSLITQPPINAGTSTQPQEGGNASTSAAQATTSPRLLVLEGSLPVSPEPASTTYRTESFTNYGGKPEMVQLPTYLYDLNKNLVTVKFTFIGDDKSGRLHFSATITSPTTKSDNLNFTSTNTPAPAAVYKNGDDLVFVWVSFYRLGFATFSQEEGFIILNPHLGTAANKSFKREYDAGQPVPLTDIFSFAIKSGSLYALHTASSGDQSLFRLKDGTITEVESE